MGLIRKLGAKGFAVAAVLLKFVAHVVHEPFHGIHRHLTRGTFIACAVALDANVSGCLGPVAELVVFQLICLYHQARLSQQGVPLHHRLSPAAPADPVGLQKGGFHFLRLRPDQRMEKKHALGHAQGYPVMAAGRDSRYQGE